MPDPSARQLAILKWLGSGRQDLADHQRSIVIADGAGYGRELGGVRDDLDVLSWAGLVEVHPTEQDRFRITDLGMEAAGV